MSSSGGGTGAPITPPGAGPAFPVCGEMLSVADVQAHYGDGVEGVTAAAIRKELDQMQAQLETTLGHGFGRVAWLWSTVEIQASVTATALNVGADIYLFADYATLGALAAAVNGAGEPYHVALATHVRPDTPSTLLQEVDAAYIGPTYDLRMTLCSSGLYFKATGGTSHLFLPLPVWTVASVTETGIAVASTGYWAPVGSTWLIRKRCSCTGIECVHPRGRWLASYPDNIAVTYTPVGWNQPPMLLGSAMVEAFGAQRELTGVSSESFLSYSYSRGAAGAIRWDDVLMRAGLRPYQVQMMIP